MVKCNILKIEINYDIIDESIKTYKRNSGKNPNYIIINQNTLNKIKKYDYDSPEFIFIKRYTEYQGIPIAVCYKLDDGEIEIV